ncbi:MAG: DinB family protein [Brevefilum sp.]
MNIQSLKKMFDYTYWSFELIWPSIDKLSDSEFVKDLGYSMGSIRNQIIHLISSHRRWLYRLQGIEPPQHLVFTDFPSKTSVMAEWADAKLEMFGYLSSLTQSDLDKEIKYHLRRGSIAATNFCWEVLLHLFNHSTDHRSQILALLNMKFNIDTPEQDFIFYLWEKQKG